MKDLIRLSGELQALSGEVRLIPLIGKRGQGLFTAVDPDVYPVVVKHRWILQAGHYAGTKISGKTVLLHRLILGVPDGLRADHINGNTLDNRGENLRICTIQENARNRRKWAPKTSAYMGVSYNQASGRWNAHIGFKGRHINLGLYDSEEYAARVRDGATLVLFGDFGLLNFSAGMAVPYVHKAAHVPASKYKGVSWYARQSRWSAYLSENGKQIHIGYFDTEEEAARARDGAIILKYGEDAPRQVPDKPPIFEKVDKRTVNKSSKYRGVSLDRRSRKWQAYIPGRPQKYIGMFNTEEAAAEAVRKAREKDEI